MPSPAVQHAAALYRAQRFAEAEAALRQALRRAPADADALGILGMTLTVLGRIDEAEHCFLRVIALRPTDAMRCNLGHLYCMRQRYDLALQQFEAAAALNPRSAAAWKGAGVCAMATKHMERALECARQAMTLGPADHEAVSLLAGAQLNNFLTQACADTLRAGVRAGAVVQVSPSMVQQHLMTLHYAHDAGPDEIAAAHRRWGPVGAAFAGPAPPPWPGPGPGPADAERVLRVGVLSSDLNRHVVANFLTPLLENSDPARLRFALFNTGKHDDTTDYLGARAGEGYDVGAADDAALLAALRGQRLDVLLECNGWTNGHRLGVVAQRAAPLQATFLGYPDTTGVPNIDVRFVDALTDPPGPADTRATEALVRLGGCFVCFAPLFTGATALAPAAERPPAFGSFANGWKLNEPLLQLWARVLMAVPSSRLVLKNMGTQLPSALERWRACFERHGVERTRVVALDWSAGSKDHLEAYHGVDIALDTFPYHGTTTTCDALFMGVPTVSLIGETHHARVGLSLLTHAGRPDWLAHSADEYVAIAAGLAARVADLRAGRAALRASFLASRVCDGRAYAAAFEAALRGAWRRVCAGESLGHVAGGR